MIHATTRTALVLGLSLWVSSPSAQEIYRWVDDDGVVHFSDTPPASEKRAVEMVEIESAGPASEDSVEDIYHVEATAARMKAIRESREAEREARRERQRNASAPVVQYPQPRGYGVPYLYPVHRPRPIPIPPYIPSPPEPEPYPPPPSTLLPPGSSQD